MPREAASKNLRPAGGPHATLLDQAQRSRFTGGGGGPLVAKHYVAAKRREWREFITQVPAWELENYLVKY